MNLEIEAYRIVLRLKRSEYTRELNSWEQVLVYATPEMSAFEIILSKVEDLVNKIRMCDDELSSLNYIKQ